MCQCEVLRNNNYINKIILNFLSFKSIYFKTSNLAGMAQSTELQTVNLTVAGSIPSQGTCLGCRPGSQVGVCERQVMSPLSKNK